MDILTDNLGFKYYLEKPKGFKQCISPVEFYCLKERKKKFSDDNIEMVEGQYLAFSPKTRKYYIRDIKPYTNPYALENLIKEGRIWIQYSPETRTKISVYFTSLGLNYKAFVRYNELLLEMEDLENSPVRYEGGFKSNIQRIKGEINYLLKHAQTTKHYRRDGEKADQATEQGEQKQV